MHCFQCENEFGQQNKHWKQASQAKSFLFELLPGVKVCDCLVFNDRHE
jgi:hypothetical protein